MRNPWLLVAAILLFAGTAAAEPVRIESGGEVGQGWASRQGDRCLVVTAAHVVASGRAEVTGAGGVKGSAASIIRHPTLDIAVINVEGALRAACPTSGWGFADTRPALNASRGGLRPLSVELVGATGNPEIIPVRLMAIDTTDPLFTVIGEDPRLAFGEQGFSGSIIREMGDRGGVVRQPLGMIIDATGEQTGIAIRFDQVRAFVQQAAERPRAPSKPPADAIPVELLGYTGETGAVGCGPLDLLREVTSPCTMDLTAPDAVSFSLAVPQGQIVVSVDVDFATDATETFSIGVSATDDRGEFVRVRSCSSSDSHARCSLAPRAVTAIRLTFDRAVQIQSIRIRGH